MAHQIVEIVTPFSYKKLSLKSLLANFRTCAAFLIMIVPIPAKAQLELYSKFNADRSAEPIIDFSRRKKLSEKFAITFLGLVRQKWSQAGEEGLPITEFLRSTITILFLCCD